MRRIQVDFARQLPVAKWVAYVASLCLLLFAAQQGMQAWKAQGKRGAVESRLEELRQQSREKAVRSQVPVPASVELPYSKDAAGLATIAQFNPGVILTALENTRVQGVRVVALDLSASEASVRVELEVQDALALTRYLEELNTGLDAAQQWALLRVQAPAGQVAGAATIRAPAVLWRR